MSHTAPSWYRCGLPSIELDWDWAGIVLGIPPLGLMNAGNLEEFPTDLNKYDAIILQQVRGKYWNDFIRARQATGQKIVYEIDDFVHGVRRIEGHTHQKDFHKAEIKWFQEAMSLCDAVICSTEFLSNQYKKYNKNQYVCRNAIDTWRYDVEIPERPHTVIGWAGGTGHHHAVGPWLEAVSNVMFSRHDVAFCSIGTNYASALEQRHPERTLSVPWVSLENYPYTLTNIDIAIAPCHVSKYYKSKSDLRWLEASAVGIPTVASPLVYKDIEHEETGLLAETPKEAEELIYDLVYETDERKRIGENAKKYVQENRDISIGAKEWETTIKKILQD